MPFASTTALVDRQFLDFRGRVATTGEKAAWVGPIDGCTATADGLISSLVPVDQTLDDARLVRLYLAFFKRPPDPSGFAYWQRQLDNGRGLVNAAKKFAESSEFKTTYGSLSNPAFVELVYVNVLDRASEPTGKAFWVKRLDNKTKNRGDVMINFSESSENVTKRRGAVDVFRLHRGMLQAFPGKAAFEALLAPITAGTGTLADAAHSVRIGTAYAARPGL